MFQERVQQPRIVPVRLEYPHIPLASRSAWSPSVCSHNKLPVMLSCWDMEPFLNSKELVSFWGTAHTWWVSETENQAIIIVERNGSLGMKKISMVETHF